jgi:hypothetical protein
MGFLAGLAIYVLRFGAGADFTNPNDPLASVVSVFYLLYLILVVVWLGWTGFALVSRNEQPASHPKHIQHCHPLERAHSGVRSLWLAVCVTATLTFLFALPARWALLAHPSPTNLANLTVLGLTPTFFATYSVFWEIIIGASYAIIGFIIYWRCRDERLALLIALKPVEPADFFPELTEREREVLSLMTQGYNNADIAERLVLSGKTIHNHIWPVNRRVLMLDPHFFWGYTVGHPCR